jgi:hypothetical protein
MLSMGLFSAIVGEPIKIVLICSLGILSLLYLFCKIINEAKKKRYGRIPKTGNDPQACVHSVSKKDKNGMTLWLCKRSRKIACLDRVTCKYIHTDNKTYQPSVALSFLDHALSWTLTICSIIVAIIFTK